MAKTIDDLRELAKNQENKLKEIEKFEFHKKLSEAIEKVLIYKMNLNDDGFICFSNDTINNNLNNDINKYFNKIKSNKDLALDILKSMNVEAIIYNNNMYAYVGENTSFSLKERIKDELKSNRSNNKEYIIHNIIYIIGTILIGTTEIGKHYISSGVIFKVLFIGFIIICFGKFLYYFLLYRRLKKELINFDIEYDIKLEK